MTKEKMTIHRALSELKLIDSRIGKATQAIEPTGFMQKGKPVNGFYEKESFENDAKAKLQSILDLIERKSRIKSAIVKANGVTNVTVAGVQMTIADAINHKNSISIKKELISGLIQKHNSVKAKVEKNNKDVEESAIRLAEVALQKDNVKINDTDALAITEPFIEKNLFNLVDPLKVEETVEKMQKDVDNFESEVDAVLSEINAITFIEV